MVLLSILKQNTLFLTLQHIAAENKADGSAATTLGTAPLGCTVGLPGPVLPSLSLTWLMGCSPKKSGSENSSFLSSFWSKGCLITCLEGLGSITAEGCEQGAEMMRRKDHPRANESQEQGSCGCPAEVLARPYLDPPHFAPEDFCQPAGTGRSISMAVQCCNVSFCLHPTPQGVNCSWRKPTAASQRGRVRR